MLPRRVILSLFASVCIKSSRAFSCGTIHSTRSGASWGLALDFARQAKYGDVLDIIVSQQRFIANMQGRTASFSTFSDAQFDEAAFEAQMMVGRTSTMICWYWILKLKARFLSCDYAAALVAADKVRALLWASATSIHLLDYYYYAALAVAALYDNASADEQQAHGVNSWQRARGATARVGRELIRRRFSPTRMRAGVGQGPTPRRARRRCDASLRRGHSIFP